ncbi:MAG: hypothetical protein ACYS76_00865 [Planctomycetota bacterium]
MVDRLGRPAAVERVAGSSKYFRWVDRELSIHGPAKTGEGRVRATNLSAVGVPVRDPDSMRPNTVKRQAKKFY